MTRGLAIVIACVIGSVALAHEGHHHPPQHAQIHNDFYQHWMRPDDRRFSCCNQKDCEPVQAKIINGRWHVLRPADQKWLPVPTSQIETERDSPDGRNHACFQPPNVGDMVYCFLAAGGT
jgi:hypothetical protein